jgi:hypothetical protein
MRACLAIQAEGLARTGWQRFWGHDPLRDEARSWLKGAVGARQVGAQFDALGPEFTVLPAVAVGKSTTDIDHVVIGPTGVFSISTKNSSGQKVWAGGRTLDGQVATHAARAPRSRRRRTSDSSVVRGAAGPIAVQPVLVVAAASLKFGKTAPAVVTVDPQNGRLDQGSAASPLRRSRPVPGYAGRGTRTLSW